MSKWKQTLFNLSKRPPSSSRAHSVATLVSTLKAAAFTLAPDPNTMTQPTARPRKINTDLSTVAPMDSPTITTVLVAPWDVAALVRD